MSSQKPGFIFGVNNIPFDLEIYKKEVDTCKKCSLGYYRTNTVIGEGKMPSDLVFIGEGPGDQEDREGRPFVGRAGELLNHSLTQVGLARNEVWITNIVKCRAFEQVDYKKVNRPPRTEEIQACFGFLEKEIEAVSPKVIVALGSPSASSLLGKNFKTITQDRGKWFNFKNIKVIPVFHPAYVLRQKGRVYDKTFETFLSDLQEAKNSVNLKIDTWNLPLFKKV
ncbi:MAG: hypothetical protein DDT22_00454 [candidate division WS2 bacterium]|nr:hypothetical protein [Candidatus Lithacetigena glycinireducens]